MTRNDPDMLPPDAMRALWAKSDKTHELSLTLEQHLDDAADVAGLLWDRWLPRHVCDAISAPAGGAAAGRALVTFLAGVHDVGKASPAFQVQGPPHLVAACTAAGFDIAPSVAYERSKLPHALAGQVALEHWLAEEHGGEHPAGRVLGSVVGGHHGLFATTGMLRDAPTRPHLLGDGPWRVARDQLIRRALHRAEAGEHLDRWRESTWPIPTQVLLTATVILADWIASNTDLFPLAGSGDVPERHGTDRLAAGWEQLGLPPRWEPEDADAPVDALLRSRFALPDDAGARPMQATVLDLVGQLESPGLLIVEAPTGEGKTEAALLAAEQMAHRWQLDGVFFALPSMSTSDAIFSRLLRWLERVPGQGDTTSVFLAHSKAGLNEQYRNLGSAADLSSIHDDAAADPAHAHPDASTGAAVAHEWLSGRKKGVLASFVVGTIDQVLFASLASRHLVLRHLGLAGKVVVIDEVHAADAYMSVYLERALAWLGAYGVPTILLSATLPARRRVALAQAYDDGRAGKERPRLGQRDDDHYAALLADRRYPLVSATTGAAPRSLTCERSDRSMTLDVAPLDDDLDHLDTLLRDSLVDGGCALVVRNTVTRAQETFMRLRERFGDDVSLVHSRFVATDRLAREQELLRRFGPPTDAVERPRRHVVVSTQVIEQSLDVDFDLLVTDVAPVDLLLQRAGRLHRHTRAGRPEAVSTARMFLTAVDWATPVPELERGSEAIYGTHALLRSLAVLDVGTGTSVSIPDDVPRLVQDAYGDVCAVPEAWETSAADARDRAIAKERESRRRANDHRIGPPATKELTSWTERSILDTRQEARARAAVRDTRESVEVIVVQRHLDGLLRPWGMGPDAPPIPVDSPPEHEQARLMAARTVTLPPRLTQPWSIDATLTALELAYVDAWQSSGWLRGELILVLDENCQCAIADSIVTYDTTLGLQVERRQGAET